MSREFVMLAGLQLGQQLLDGLLHIGEFPNERIPVIYREITRLRCVISTFQVAESMGFKGDFRQLDELLRIGD